MRTAKKPSKMCSVGPCGRLKTLLSFLSIYLSIYLSFRFVSFRFVSFRSFRFVRFVSFCLFCSFAHLLTIKAKLVGVDSESIHREFCRRRASKCITNGHDERTNEHCQTSNEPAKLFLCAATCGGTKSCWRFFYGGGGRGGERPRRR